MLQYYDSGELKATTNALSERTELEYDKLGRLVKKTTRKGMVGEQVTTFTYDQPRTNYFNVGFLTKMNDSAGYREDDYDSLGRPAKTLRNLDSQNHVFEFFYNAAGLPSSRTYPDSQTIFWTYDGGGNLETETGTIASSEYDAARRLKTRTFQNGVVSTYQYSDTRDWVESIDTVKGATVIQDLTYTHYPDGMVESVSSARPGDTWSWTYGYDDLNRLLTATNSNPALSQSFTYNDIGNMTSNNTIGTYTYPATGTARPHAVSTADPRSYSYNAIGQMTSRNGTVIQWNGDGKPSSIGGTSFVYDGVGVRLKKTTGSQTTRYLGADYEIALDGTVTKYLQGGKKVGAQFFMHHRDHLGSIQSVTDASGVEVRGRKHKPFGDQFGVTGSHPESKGWIGEREEETELVYLNARVFDPEIGRFTAPDPIIHLGQSLNRYTYSLNSPITLLDPTGLQCASSTGGFLAGVQIYLGYDTCGSFPAGGPLAGGGNDGGAGVGFGARGREPNGPDARERHTNGNGSTSTGTNTGTDTGADAGTGNGTGTGSGTESETGTAAGTSSGTGTGTGTATETGPGTETQTGATDASDLGDDVSIPHPDLMVFSGSWSAFPFVVGAGSGFEAVAFDSDRWDLVGYSHWDYGVGVPGASALFAFGWGWNVNNPDDYTGAFDSFGWGIGGDIPLGRTIFWSPTSDAIGFTIGIYLGTPGVSLTRENYNYLNPAREQGAPLPRP